MINLVLWSCYLLMGLVSFVFLMIWGLKLDTESERKISKEDFGANIVLSLLGSVIWPATWLVIAGAQIFNKIWTSLEPKLNKRN